MEKNGDLQTDFGIDDSSLFELRLDHDATLYGERRSFDEIIRTELRRHSDRLNKVHDQYKTRTEDAVRSIESQIEKEKSRSSREHSDRVEEVRRLGSEKVEANLEKLKGAKAKLSELSECVKNQEKRLVTLRKRNEELTTPVKRLESEIAHMQKEIDEYNGVVKPGLEAVKKRVSALKKDIREKSLYLECLVQRKLILEKQPTARLSPNLIDSIDMILDNMSVATTSGSL